MMWNYGPGLGRFGAAEWIWLIAMVAFWVLVVAVLVLAVRWLLRAGGSSGRSDPPSAPPTPRPDDPLEILRQRYARGEIDEEEYARRKATLGGG